MLSFNLHRVQSFNHHRINADSKDFHEQPAELVDSNELQETTTIDAQSDEQVDSEENNNIVKRQVLQLSFDHSSEENNSTSLDNQSDERDDVILVKLVKRNIPVVDHSSEEQDTIRTQHKNRRRKRKQK